MNYLIKILGENKNVSNCIITMKKGKILTFEFLYDACTKLQYELTHKGAKYKITCFEISIYDKKNELLGVTSLNAFNRYILSENKYPENIKEVIKYN